MKTIIYPFIIAVCSTFLSCPFDSTSDFYYQCFFLGEESFSIDNGDWTTTIKHYDFNFSKPGWYRIIQFYNNFRNVPKNLLETNNYFYFVKFSS
jgi:hypothetical protein